MGQPITATGVPGNTNSYNANGVVDRIDPERLAGRIKASGLSYTKLAKEAGLHQPAISRLLKGQQYGTSRLHQLARALGTTPAYLSGETDDPLADGPSPPMLSHDELEWLNLYRGMNDQQRGAALTLLRPLVDPMATPLPTMHSPNDVMHDLRPDAG